MTPPVNIDGTDITGATIDGQEVQEITVDGQTVFTAGLTTDSVVFDFETGDLSNWQNQSGQESITTSIVNEGSFACLSDGPGGAADQDHIYSVPGDGLNNYPSPDGTTFSYAQYNEDAGDHRFGFAAPGTSSDYNDAGYELAHRPGNGRFELNVNGSSLDTDGTTPPTGEWLINKIRWSSNGDIKAEVEDTTGSVIARLSANDSTYTSRGAVFIAGRSTGSGGKVFFDGVQI